MLMSLCAYLVTPLVDDGHVDVINEHCHLPASWRPIRAAHTFVNIALNGSLQVEEMAMQLRASSLTGALMSLLSSELCSCCFIKNHQAPLCLAQHRAIFV